jgi:hypothetical protein
MRSATVTALLAIPSPLTSGADDQCTDDAVPLRKKRERERPASQDTGTESRPWGMQRG